MPEIAETIPPEAWPFIDQLFVATLVVAAIWLVLSGFVLWRRKASNLTPVSAAGKSKSAQPDFLKVDSKAREAAIARGESFDKELARRERREASRAASSPATLSQRIAGAITFLMSLFTLATMIYGAIFQVSRMGSMMKEYSSFERIVLVIQRHPIAFSVAVFVILFHIYRYFAQRKWQEA